MASSKIIESEEDLNREAELFEKQVEITCGIKKFMIKPKKPGPNKQATSNVPNKHRLRGLYDYQKHRALQEIIIGPTVYCPINAIKIEKHYAKMLSTVAKCQIDGLPESLWPKKSICDKVNLALTRDFMPNEVKYKLLSKIHNPLSSSRSLGLDRINFKHLHLFDSDHSRMTFLFNACLKFQTVPKLWMEFHSVLVKAKHNDVDNSNEENVENNGVEDQDLYAIRNWHTITMHRTISKLFQSLLAARLITWAKNAKRLTSTQKGFLMHDAACESSFILQECNNYARDNDKDLAVAWLDFSNASDFISQSTVLHALSKHSVPSSIVKIIQKMLEFSNTKIRVMDNCVFTKPIQILKGLPQGSSIAPIVLDLVMEPILKALFIDVKDTFQIYNRKINHYAIPNELILLADSSDKLRNLLDLVEKNATLIGLKFNISKCATYHYEGKVKLVKSDNKFLFYRRKLRTLAKDEIEKYFGVKLGVSIGQDSIPDIQEMIDNIEDIDKSSLSQFQKLESILLFVIPRVESCLRGLSNIDTELLKKAEQVLKDKFKKWLNLHSEANTESIVFQVAAMKHTIKDDLKKSTKYNYLPFMDLCYVMKVVHGLKMLTSQDDIVKTVAFATLTDEVDSLIANKKTKNLTKEQLAKYLSGELHIKNKKLNSTWYLVRDATLKLKIKIPLTWQYNHKMYLIIKSENKKQPYLSKEKKSSSVEEMLKSTLVEYYINQTMINSSGPDNNLKAVRLNENNF